MIIRETFRSLEKLLILVALGLDQRSKAKEGARVVLLPLTRGCGNKVDQPIIASNLQNIAEGCHQHVAGGGREIGTLASELLDKELPITCRQFSDISCSKVTNQAPIVVVEKETRGANIVLVALTIFCELLSSLDEPMRIGLEAELLIGRSIGTHDLVR